MDKKQETKNQKSNHKKALKYVVAGIFVASLGAGVAAGAILGINAKTTSDSNKNQQSINAIDLQNSNYNTNYYINLSKESPTLTAYFNFNNINEKDVSYTWYACDANGNNSVLIQTLNSSTFLPTIKTNVADTYYYYCVASYKKISAKSKVFVINVLNLPKITINANSSVDATLNETQYQLINPTISNLGSYNASYQWYSTNPSYDTKGASSTVYNDTTYYEIPNATSSNYTLDSSDVTSVGTFHYIVKANVKLNSDYTYDYYSNVVDVNVKNVASPTINNGQSTYTIVQNQTSNLPTFTPSINNGNNLTYQWYSTNPYFKNDKVQEINGVNYYVISDAINLTYNVSSNEVTTLGTYDYVLGVTSSLNGSSVTVYSSPYTVTVNAKSSITINTINDATAYINQTNDVTFSANVTVPSIYDNVSYTWYEVKNGKDTVVASGSNTFTISSFPTTGTFSYFLQINASSNGATSTAISNTFTLTVNNVTNNVTFSGNNTLTVYSGQSNLPQLTYTINGLSNNTINTYQWYTTNPYYSKNDSVSYDGVVYYAVTDATNSTLTLNSSALNTIGTYKYILVVTSDFNGNKQTYSSSTTPFVIDLKTLTASSIVFGNTNYNLNVTLNNLTSADKLNVYATVNDSSSHLTYQWFNASNNTKLTDQTASVLTINNELLQSFNNQSFSVYCVVSYSYNGLSFSANSSTYNVVVSSVPTVTFANNSINIDAIVNETSYQTIYANASSSNDNLTVYYEWYKTDSSFTVSTNAFSSGSSYTLTQDDVNQAQTLYYVVKAYTILNGVKYYATNNLEVTVNVQPASNSSIAINNPTNTVFNTYVSSTNNINLGISVVANKVSNLTYQWYSSTVDNDTAGTAINNENSSLYQFNASKLTSSEVIYYYCVVSGDVSGVVISKTSAIFTVYVNPKPTISFNSDLTYQKSTTTGTNPITLYTAAVLSGFTDLNVVDNSLNNIIISYTWYTSSGKEVGTGTSYTLTTSEMNSSSNLTFYVIASASFNGITVSQQSNNYVVTFNALPTLNSVTINSNYYNVFTDQENSINLTSNFTALDNPSIIYTYQWYTSNTDTAPTLSTLNSYTKITGATNNTYSFNSLATSTYYFLVVSASLDGASLTPVISNMLEVNVLAKPTITFNNNINYDISTTHNATNLPTLYTGASLSDFTNNAITYTWYGNTTNSTTGAVALNETGTSLALSTDLLKKYDYFYVVATSVINGSTITNTSEVYVINYNDEATISFNNDIKYNLSGYQNQTDSIILQTNATSSNNGTITYTWYNASTNDEVWTGASFTFSSFSATGTFTYYVVASTIQNGTVISQKSKTYTITINVLPTITLSSNYTNNTVDATLNETNYQTLVVNASINANFNLTYSWSNDTQNSSNTYQLGSSDVNEIGPKTIICTVSADINGYTITKTITFTINVSNNATVVWNTLTNYSYSTITQAKTPIQLSVSANSSVGNYPVSYSWYETNTQNATLQDLSSLTDLNNNTANYSFNASEITKSETLYLYVVASFNENGVTVKSLSTPFTIVINQAPSIVWNNSTYSAYNDQTNDLVISAVANLSNGFTNSITYTWPDGSTGSSYTVDASSFDTSKTSITVPVTATSVVDGYTITSTSNITINLTKLPTLSLSSNSGTTINVTQDETIYQTIYSDASFSSSNNYGINYAWFTNSSDISNLSNAVQNAINNTSSFTLNSNYVKSDNVIYEVAYTVINGKTVYSNVLTYNIKVSQLPQVTFNSTTTNYNLITNQTIIPTLNATATAGNENVSYAWFELSSNAIPTNLVEYLTSHTSLSASNNYTPSFTATTNKYYLCIAYVLNNGVYALNSLLFTYNVINDITITQTNKTFDYDTTIQATNPLVLNSTFSINNLPSNTANWNIGQITYQWYSTDSKNTSGTVISGQTNASYDFSAANITSATTKYVYVIASVVINGVTITSTTITTYNINITNAPTINWTSGLTLTYNVLTGTDLTLNASATSSDSSYTIYYLWNNADESTASSITLKDLTASQTISVNAWIVVNGTKYTVSKPLTYTINVLNKPNAYFTYNTTTQTKTVYDGESGNTVLTAPTINVVSNSSNYDVSNANVYYEWYNSSNPNTVIGNSASLTLTNNSITSSQTYYVKAYYLIDGIKCYIQQSSSNDSLQSTNYTINYSTLSKIAFNNQTSYTWYTNNTLPSVSVNVINNTNNLSIQYIWTYNNQTLDNNDSATLSSDNLNKILNATNGSYSVNVTANLILNNAIVQTITETITLNYLADPTLSFNNTSLNSALTLSNTVDSKNPIILNGSVSVSGDTNAVVSLVYSWYNSANTLISSDSSYSFSANSSVSSDTYTLKVEAIYNGKVVATLTSGLITIKTVANPTITLTTKNNTTINYLNGYKISQILSVDSTLSGVSYTWTWNNQSVTDDVANLDLNTLTDFKTTNTLSVYATLNVNGNTITSNTITFTINTLSINTNDFRFLTINNNISYTSTLPTLTNTAIFTQSDLAAYVSISYNWYSNSTLTDSLNNNSNSYTLTSNIWDGTTTSYFETATLSINGIFVNSTTQIFNVSRLALPTIKINSLSSNQSIYANSSEQGVLNVYATLDNALNWSNVSLTYTWYNASTNEEVGNGATLYVTPTSTTSYYVEITGTADNNALSEVTSNNITITVLSQPTLTLSTNQTSTIDYYQNQTSPITLTTSLSTNSSFKVSYVWTLNGTSFSNDINSYTISNFDASSYTYTVYAEITDGTFTSPIKSNTITFTLSAQALPTNTVIANQTTYTVYNNQSTSYNPTLSVTLANSTNATVTYNWYSSETIPTNLKDANNSIGSGITYVNSNKYTTTMYYYAIATVNYDGVITRYYMNNYITVDVVTPTLSINSLQTTYNLISGISSNPTLSVSLTNPQNIANVSYVWKNSDGSTLNNSSSSYTLSSIPTSNTTYTVYATGTINGVTVQSKQITFTIDVSEPTISNTNFQIVLTGNSVFSASSDHNNTIDLTVNASSNITSAHYTYTWYENGNEIPNSNVASLPFSIYEKYLTADIAVSFSVVVTLTIGNTTLTLNSLKDSSTFASYNVYLYQDATISGNYHTTLPTSTTSLTIYQDQNYTLAPNITVVSNGNLYSYQWVITNLANNDVTYGTLTSTYNPINTSEIVDTSNTGNYEYYLKITLNGDTYYSDVYKISINTNNYSSSLSYNGTALKVDVHLASGMSGKFNLTSLLNDNNVNATYTVVFGVLNDTSTNKDITVNSDGVFDVGTLTDGSYNLNITSTYTTYKTFTTTFSIQIYVSSIQTLSSNFDWNIAVSQSQTANYIYANQTANLPTFSVSANAGNSGVAFSYEWLQDSTKLDDTSSSFDLLNTSGVTSATTWTCNVYVIYMGIPCLWSTQTFSLKVYSASDITLASNTLSYTTIVGQGITLSQTALLGGNDDNFTYNWNNSASTTTSTNGSSYTFNETTAGAYSVVLLITLGNLTKTVVYTITVLPNPSITYDQTNSTINIVKGQTTNSLSFGITYSLNPDNSYYTNNLTVSYSWKNSSGTVVSTSSSYTPSASADTYTLTITFTLNKEIIATKTLTYSVVQYSPTITLNGGQALYNISTTYGNVVLSPQLTISNLPSDITSSVSYSWTLNNSSVSSSDSYTFNNSTVGSYVYTFTYTYLLNDVKFTGSTKYTINVSNATKNEYTLNLSNLTNNTLTALQYGASTTISTASVSLSDSAMDVVGYSYDWLINNNSVYTSQNVTSSLNSSIISSYKAGTYTVTLNVTLTLINGSTIDLTTSCSLTITAYSLTINANVDTTINAYNNQKASITLNPIINTNNNLVSLSYDWNNVKSDGSTYTITNPTDTVTTYTLTVTATYDGKTVDTATITYTLNFISMPTFTISNSTPNQIYYINANTSTFPTLTPNIVVSGDAANFDVHYSWSYNTTNDSDTSKTIDNSNSQSYSLSTTNVNYGVGTYYYWLTVTIENTSAGVSASYVLSVPYEVIVSSSIEITNEPVTNTSNKTTTFTVGQNYTIDASAQFEVNNNQDISYYWEELSVNPSAKLSASDQSNYNVWTPIVGQTGSGENNVVATLSLGSTISTTPTQEFRCVFYQTNDPSNQVISNTITITTTYDSNTQQEQNLESLLSNPYWDMGLLYSYGGTALLNLLYGQNSGYNNWNIFGLQITGSSGYLNQNAWTGNIESIRFIPSGSSQFGDSEYQAVWSTFLVQIQTTSNAYIMAYTNSWQYDHLTEIPAGTTVEMYLPFYFFGSMTYTTIHNNVLTSTRSLSVSSDGSSSVSFTGSASDSSYDWSAFKIMFNNDKVDIGVYGHSFNGGNLINGDILEFQLPSGFGNGTLTFTTANTDGYLPDYAKYSS